MSLVEEESVKEFSALAAMMSASSTQVVAAAPYLQVSRQAYSLESFNKQFRRLSQFTGRDEEEEKDEEDEESVHGHHCRSRERRRGRLAKLISRRSQTSRSSVATRKAETSERCDWLKSLVMQLCVHLSPLALVRQHFPIIEWLCEYRLVNLAPDLLSGLTIIIFHIPESMGYSFLANVSPIYCLYSSFFPTLVYALMGTSPHVSVGTFAALTIMTGTTIEEAKLAIQNDMKLLTPYTNTSEVTSLAINSTEPYSNAEIAFTCAFIVGFYNLAFGLVHFGFLSVYMSEQFLNGFTCSVAFHVLLSQLKHMLGLKHNNETDSTSGFMLFRYAANIVNHWGQVNRLALVITFVTLVVLFVSKYLVDPWLYRRTRKSLSFPIEFMIVFVGILISWLFDLNGRYHLPIVGPLPQGLPSPEVPKVRELFKYLWQPCITIAVVSYAITYSLGRTFADQMLTPPPLAKDYKDDEINNNENYNEDSQESRLIGDSIKIDPSQEMVALGCSNLISSFFSCLPSGASLSRTALQVGSGGRTQLVSLVNCAGILIFLLYLSSWIETLPEAILATIISFAIRKLLTKIVTFRDYWKVSRVDASVWLVTFATVLVIDINWGVYIGLLYSLFTLIYKSQLPPTHMLGAVGSPGEFSSLDFYVPIEQYVSARELPGIRIYQFCGPLHFANVDYFVSQLEAKLTIVVKDLKKLKAAVQQFLRRHKLPLEAMDPWTLGDDQGDEVANDEFDDLLGLSVICGSLDTGGGGLCNNYSIGSLVQGHGAMMGSLGSFTGHKLSMVTQKTWLKSYRRYMRRIMPRYLIIDCSMFSYIDTDGMRTLTRLIGDFDFLSARILLGGCPPHVGRLLERFTIGGEFDEAASKLIFISVPDAIEHAKVEQNLYFRRRLDYLVAKGGGNSGKFVSSASGLYYNHQMPAAHLHVHFPPAGSLPTIIEPVAPSCVSNENNSNVYQGDLTNHNGSVHPHVSRQKDLWTSSLDSFMPITTPELGESLRDEMAGFCGSSSRALSAAVRKLEESAGIVTMSSTTINNETIVHQEESSNIETCANQVGDSKPASLQPEQQQHEVAVDVHQSNLGGNHRRQQELRS